MSISPSTEIIGLEDSRRESTIANTDLDYKRLGLQDLIHDRAMDHELAFAIATIL
jgi:hypothetical protein